MYRHIVPGLLFPLAGEAYLASLKRAIRVCETDEAARWARWLVHQTRETPEGRAWWRDWRREVYGGD